MIRTQPTIGVSGFYGRVKLNILKKIFFSGYNKMKLLELFSGTHSIGKVCDNLNIDVVSLDRDLPDYDKSDTALKYKSKHHIKSCLLEWDYKKDFKEGEFDIITASPSCFYWSQLRKCWINSYYNVNTMKFSRTEKEGYIKFTEKELQDDINKYGKPQVDKIIEILEYFKPKYYWIENPKGSSMKNYLYEKGYKNDIIVSYCKYGFPYQKHTRFWTNIPNFKGNICKNDCEFMVEIDKKLTHNKILGNGYEMINGVKTLCNTKELREKKRINEVKKELKFREQNKNTKEIGGGTNRLERYKIPPKLIKELLELCI